MHYSLQSDNAVGEEIAVWYENYTHTYMNVHYVGKMHSILKHVIGLVITIICSI